MKLTLDQCGELIEAALASSTREAFQRLVSPLVDEFGILSFGIGRNQTYWRARIIEKERYDQLKELDYPPAELVKRPGRLNDIHAPCFYISSTLETAIAEVQPELGQLVQVAGFRIVPEKILQLIFLGEYYHVEKRGFTSYSGHDPGQTVRKLLDQHPLEERRTHLLIDNFFAHVISDKEASRDDYLHSRALRDLLLAKVSAHGIAFPSARDPGGINFGVLPEPSDDLFHNVCCLVMRVGKKRRFASHDLEYVGAVGGLTDNRKGFVWESDPKPTKIVMYNMTKQEYEEHTSLNA